MFVEPPHRTGKVRTASSVATRSCRLAPAGQRENRSGTRRCRVVRPDGGRFACEAVAPQSPVDGPHKHDGQLHDETGHGFGLRRDGRRARQTPSGKKKK